MPNLSMTRRELKSGDLPQLCMKCGTRTKKPMAKTLVFWPPMVRSIVIACTFLGGLVLGPIAWFALRSRIVRISSKLPICARHRRHWNKPIYVMFGSMAVGLVLLIAAIFLGGESAADIVPAIAVGLAVATVIGLGVGALMWSRAIVVESVERRNVELINVCKEFIEALQEQRGRRAAGAESEELEKLEAEDTDVVEEEVLPSPPPQKRLRVAAPAPADGESRPKPSP